MSVLAAVQAEREKQDAKWGKQNHNNADYFAILAEEFGEVAKEVVELNAYNGLTNHPEYIGRMKNLREELIQTAAVAVAMVECLERNHQWLYGYKAVPLG